MARPFTGIMLLLFLASSISAQEHGRIEGHRIDVLPPIDSPSRLRRIPGMPTPILNKGDLAKKGAVTSRIVGDLKRTVLMHSGSAVGLPTVGQPAKVSVSDLPYANAGKLIFEVGGSEAACTAEFVGNYDILLTAAHCVRDGFSGQWFSAFRFYRGYHKGNGQFVTVRCMATWSDWWSSGSPNYGVDYAFIKTNEHSAAGWFGLETGLSYSMWNALGYPEELSSGQVQYAVLGTAGTVSSSRIEMVGNPMGPGSSGGAWSGDVTNSALSGNHVFSVNSSHDQSGQNMYGPLFDAAVANLYNYVENDCQ